MMGNTLDPAIEELRLLLGDAGEELIEAINRMLEPVSDSLQKLAKIFKKILMQQELEVTKQRNRPHGKPPHHSPEKKTRLKSHQKILKYFGIL